jgi:hypothetical protein
MEQMTTLSEIINKLKNEGYTEDFNLNGDSISAGTEVKLHPEHFVVDRHFRSKANRTQMMKQWFMLSLL